MYLELLKEPEVCHTPPDGAAVGDSALRARRRRDAQLIHRARLFKLSLDGARERRIRAGGRWFIRTCMMVTICMRAPPSQTSNLSLQAPTNLF